MPERTGSGRPHEGEGGGKGSRRDFLRKGARAMYVAPLVVTYSIAELYDEESGYARAQGPSPPPMHHGQK